MSTAPRSTRRAAQTATANLSAQLGTETDSESERDEFRAKPLSRTGSKRGRGRGGSTRGRGKGKVTDTPRRESISRPPTHKRPQEFISISDDDEVETIAVSSPGMSQKKLMSAQSLSTLAGPSRTASFVELPWSINDLPPYAWVLVSTNGKLWDDSDAEEYIWWPTKCTRLSNETLSLELFGRLLPRPLRFTLSKPSSENILSLTRGGPLRFVEPQIQHLPSALHPNESPRKKFKRDHTDLFAQWHRAVEDAVRAMDDEMPDMDFVISTSNFRNTTARGDASSATISENEEDIFWEPPGPDDALDIPDERVFARTIAAENVDHWPALIKAYVAPVSRKQKSGKYLLEYLDGRTKTVPREWFHALGDPGFRSCKLGRFDSVVVSHTRDESDAWEDGPLAETDDYSSLSLREQFRYITPIIDAILRNQYAPANQTFTIFMSKHRSSLNSAAAYRGRVTEADVERLNHWVLEYCLREQRHATRIEDDGLETSASDTTLVASKDLSGEDNTTATNNVTQPTSLDRTATSEQAITLDTVATTTVTPITAIDDIDAIKSSTVVSSMDEGGTCFSEETNMLECRKESGNKLSGGDEAVGKPGSPETTPQTTKVDTSRLDALAAFASAEPPVSLDGLALAGSAIKETIVDTKTETTTTKHSVNDDVTMEAAETLSVEKLAVSSSSGLSTPAVVDSCQRPRGCDQYENLSVLGKMDFCSNVVLPEAIKQILLWREDIRKSHHLLSEDEENQLSKQGEELIQESDWVSDLTNVRDTLEKHDSSNLKELKRRLVGGTRGRPIYELIE